MAILNLLRAIKEQVENRFSTIFVCRFQDGTNLSRILMAKRGRMPTHLLSIRPMSTRPDQSVSKLDTMLDGITKYSLSSTIHQGCYLDWMYYKQPEKKGWTPGP